LKAKSSGKSDDMTWSSGVKDFRAKRGPGTAREAPVTAVGYTEASKGSGAAGSSVGGTVGVQCGYKVQRVRKNNSGHGQGTKFQQQSKV
jgi:hypothetical protein